MCALRRAESPRWMCGSNELDLDGVANRCTYVRRVVDLPRKKNVFGPWLAINHLSWEWNQTVISSNEATCLCRALGSLPC